MASTSIERQIDRLERDLLAAMERGAALFARVPEDAFWQPPEAGRWSVGECLGHLNLTDRAMLEQMENALRDAEPGPPRRRYRLGLVGSLLVWALEPGRFPLPTTAPFVPERGGSILALREEFLRLVQLLIATARRGTSVDLGRLRMASPFRESLRYSVYSSLRITEVHLRRHLQQAEQAAKALGVM